MKLRFIRIGLALAGNALGLWLASILLDKMSIDGLAFVMAVLVFSVLDFVLEPLFEKMTEESARVVQMGSALITTAISLFLTAWISDGLEFDGIGTWLIATVIVWAGTLLIGVLLARFVLRKFTDR